MLGQTYQYRITTNGYSYGVEHLFRRCALLRWLGFKPVWLRLRWTGKTLGMSFSSWWLLDAPVAFATKEEAEQYIAYDEDQRRRHDGTFLPCNPNNE